MEPRQDEPPSSAPAPPVRLWRTLRFGVRATWDALGLVCVASLSLFVGAALPLGLLVKAGGFGTGLARAAAAAGAAGLWILLVPPLYAGVCFAANQVMAFEEASWVDIWRGFGRLYGRAVALGLIQLLVMAALAANVLFYLWRGSFPFIVIAIVFLYLLLFWAMNCLYQVPLLVAGETGVLRREDGGKPGVASALRNGLVLALTSPGFTLGLLAAIIAVSVPLAASGVGIALLGGGLSAFLAMRATRDQLVRFGVLVAPPDPDAPASDGGWRV